MFASIDRAHRVFCMEAGENRGTRSLPIFKPRKSSIGLTLGFYAHYVENYPLFACSVLFLQK